MSEYYTSYRKEFGLPVSPERRRFRGPRELCPHCQTLILPADKETHERWHRAGSTRPPLSPRERPPGPAVESSDTKIVRHEQQTAEKLRRDIRGCGEAGWRSPWSTGTTGSDAYLRWRDARQRWTETGKEEHKQVMLAAVDFDCPPDAPPPGVAAPVKHNFITPKQQLMVFITAYIIGIFIVILIGTMP